MEKYQPGIGIAAGCLMLKWNTMDAYIHRDDKIQRGSDVDLFISFESILRNLTLRSDLSNTISFFRQDCVLELEAAILNMVAHYRSYFNKERCHVRVFLYYTDLNFESQMMSEHNKFYRNYYHNQYCQNQKYKAIGDIISNIVVPEIRTILSFVPDCYFLESKKFDSSVIPLIVDEASPERSSVIITSDVFDTLYLMEKNFVTLYIKRRYANLTIISDVEAAVQSIITGVDAFQLTTFNEDMYFKLLLSVKGSKIRNIQSAKGFGYGKFIKLVNDAIGSGSILRDFKSIDSIIDIFPEKYREDIRTAYKCTDIRFQFSLLTDADKKMILDQIIDLSDIQSVENLNNVRFQKYQINIPGLLQ